MEESEARTIGSMNGPWAALLKVALATYPLLMMWCAWVTVSIVATNSNRYTSQDGLSAANLNVKARHEMHRSIDTRLRLLERHVLGAGILPKAEVRLDRVEARLKDLERSRRGD